MSRQAASRFAVRIDAVSPEPFRRDATVPAGQGEVCVIRAGARSVVRRAYATSPLRLLTPGNPGRAAWIYTSSFGGGLVGGDRITLGVEVAAGAAACVLTQASTKVYRSPRGASVALEARVGCDALLLMLPDPVVCFAGSTYRQTQQFDLARGASVAVLDWMSSGRRASGERWAFDRYETQLSVRLDDRLLVHDALAIRANDGDLAARMGRFDVIGIAALIGPALAAPVEAIVSRIQAMAVKGRADILLAVTRLGGHGCVFRIAGRSVEQAGRTIRELLGFVPAMIGDNPWARKW